jgi:CRP-like cAMP-binding protein
MAMANADLQIEFLCQIPAEHRERLLALAQHRHFSPGEVLFREGSLHSQFHLISQGHVRLVMSLPHRGRIPILTAGPGDVLAWSSLASNGMMTTTAEALERVTTIAFDGPQLRQLCEQDSAIGYHVMKQLVQALSRRLVATRLQLLDLFVTHEHVTHATTHPDATAVSTVASSIADDQC